MFIHYNRGQPLATHGYKYNAPLGLMASIIYFKMLDKSSFSFAPIIAIQSNYKDFSFSPSTTVGTAPFVLCSCYYWCLQPRC